MKFVQFQPSTYNQQKRTTMIGDYLYIVEGAVRWGLYDLLRGTMTLLDKESGDLLDSLSRAKSVPTLEKHFFLREYIKAIWDQVKRLEIAERLFKRDTSPKPEGGFLDLLWLEVTDACNEKCIHCYAESGPMRKTFMPLALSKEVIRQGREEGFSKLQLVGGEPFVHQDLWKMVEYAHGLYYPEIEIYTNLTLIKQADLERIKTFDVRIATSLLGYNAETHDALTKTPGSFRRWYDAIKEVQKRGIPYRIGVVRMKQNEDLMNDIEKFLRDEELLNSDEPFNPDDVRPLGRGGDDNLQPTKLPNELYLIVKPLFFHKARCYNTCWRGEIAIAPNGDVYPCVFSRNLVVGDINKEDLRTVLRRLKRTYWNITLDQVEKCRDCEFRYACMDCRALSINAGKGLYGSPVRCDYDPYH